MKTRIESTFGINLKLLRITGLYQFKEYSLWYNIYDWIIYVVLIYPVPILGMVQIFTRKPFDITTLANNAFIIYEWIFFISKLFVFVRHGKEARDCILYLQSPVFIKQVCNKKQIAFLDKCEQICKRNTRIYICSVCATTFLWAIRPFFQSKITLPIDLWVPFDMYSDWRIFYTLYFYSVCGGVYSTAASSGMDTMIPGLFCQVAYQFKVLKDNLQFLSDYADQDLAKYKENREENVISQDEIIYTKICDCIVHHNKIVKCCQLYEKFFSTTSFSQAVSSTFVICICCLELSMVEPFTMPYIYVIVFLFTMLCQVFLYCYYGTVLNYESDTLREAICMGKWYTFNNKSKKLLIILMERSKKSVRLTAGYILELSLTTFTMICKKSYSLLAVLQHYNN